MIEEKVLANSTKMCYTYDELSRATLGAVKDEHGIYHIDQRHGAKAIGSLTICKQHILGEINKYF